ncbi:ferric reductase like transmembrane component-domain-containing protein [Dichotomocladium elegans]|nr:ferric reductase like transmembrane component-domain-containing protein [Dichotomocladium elegans]
MPTELHPFTDFHKAGYMYLLVFWAAFLGYSALYQIDRFMKLWMRRQHQLGMQKGEYIKASTKTIRPFERSMSIPYVATMISVKHLTLMTLFIIVNIIFCWFAPFRLHPMVEKYEWPILGILDRRMAYVSMANWSFTIVLGTRNSIITELSGLTFEQFIPFHRWCGRLGLAEMALHIVYRIIVGYQENKRIYDAFFLDEEYTSGTLSTVGYALLFGTSFYFIRRQFFRIFYYSHIIGMIIGTGGAMWHEWSCIYFFYPPTFLWLLDRAIRSYRSWALPTRVLSLTHNGRLVHAVFHHAGLHSIRPGQYFFAKFFDTIPGAMDWYPMTVSNVEGREKASIHIKALGDDTTRLLEAVRDEHAKKVGFRVDGPYGPRLRYMDYKTVALFAVGIGITPAMMILKDCVQEITRQSCVRQLFLVWSVTTAGKIAAFLLGCTVVHGRRPNIPDVMSQIPNQVRHRPVWVHTCGSIPFMNSVINEAVRHRFDFHHETFEF